MEDNELKKALETLLFITDHPLPLERLAQLCEIRKEERVAAALEDLKREYAETGRALQVMQVAGGYQLATLPEYSIWVRRLYNTRMTVRLSNAALETLCIIAYKQPITRAEVEAIRGVEVIGPLETLMERKLIAAVGRKETVGRPLLYGTTSEFLRQFGLNALDDLPKLDTMVVEKPIVPPPAPDQAAVFSEVEAEDKAAQAAAPVETPAEGAPPADPAAGPEAEWAGTPSPEPVHAPAAGADSEPDPAPVAAEEAPVEGELSAEPSSFEAEPVFEDPEPPAEEAKPE